MATAIVKTEKKTVTKEVPQKVVTLELSELEARVLRDIVGTIAGDPRDTYRREVEAINTALTGLGYWYSGRYLADGRLTANGRRPGDV